MNDLPRLLRPRLLAPILVIAVVALSLVVTACGGDDDDATSEAEGTATSVLADESPLPGQSDGTGGTGPGTSVEVIRWQEIQCLGNPWEEAWLAEEGAQPEDYPQQEAEQLAIFQEYWREQDILVFSPTFIPPDPGVSYPASCDSPSGREIEALLPRGQIDAALAAGFTRAPEPTATPQE